jgi:hypothetical protein
MTRRARPPSVDGGVDRHKEGDIGMRKLPLVLAGLVVALGAATFAAIGAGASDRPAAPAHDHASHAGTVVPAGLAPQLARARLATAPFATSLAAAKKAGYRLQITPNMPNMGYHFLNGSVKGFDVRKPPILVYTRRGRAWQLVAFEWVWPTKPARPPLPGARYGSFAAACHYADGQFVAAAAEGDCARTHSRSGAAFTFWHPDLVTLHVWLWYPNPDGVYAGTNPLLAPFNGT